MLRAIVVVGPLVEEIADVDATTLADGVGWSGRWEKRAA